MAKDTIEIVASNLVVAYCANHKKQLTEEQLVELFKRFVELLTPAPQKVRFGHARI